MEQIQTRYARNADIHVAYQVFGEGDVDLIFVPGFISHIENYWDEPNLARWLRRLGSFSRTILFDKQGTGLSDRVGTIPGLDVRMDDVCSVMDAEGIEKAAIFGISEGGSLTTLFAASHPDRVRALILFGAFARFSSWIPNQEAMESFFQYIDNDWGRGESLMMFAPTMENDPTFKQWWGKFERLGGSPGSVKNLILMNSRIDIADILPSVKVPALVIHRRDDIAVDVEAGRFLAQSIPNAKYKELSGVDHVPWVGKSSNQILNEMSMFLTGAFPQMEMDRILTTVLFTDIVESTRHLLEMGDQRWRNLLERHHGIVRENLKQFRGQEIDTAGDGFFAIFNGPARAIHCACAITGAVKGLGISIRAGLHTGECEVSAGKVSGIAVHIGSRVMGQAGPGEVLVSSTVKDLVAGSGLHFIDREGITLKGIPGERRLFAVKQDL
ncbi:MAG: adenylate/guanylate cyclase domain-containing protein [Deltaproteobacteria bacterium]|uniref:adenylate/guanylate cyclase domain-containing protein n=1 Tax=Desulfobacula sp. TaxID=2593537 RepID=UPI0019AADE54|nr:adenylate/guanylate cyclase domain-containing protein [Candidatus Desulfobacula maris]MBL6995351.1 adenylate/guanylate cyclase domain-containing protein [Desulfobacula sp.]